VSYLKPVFSRFDLGEGHWVHAYTPDKYLRIVSGYACGNCGEDYGGERKLVCPVCRMVHMNGSDDRPGWTG